MSCSTDVCKCFLSTIISLSPSWFGLVCAFRYDVVKMILEYGMVSPQPVAGGDTERAGSPRKRMSSMSYSPGMLALSKYWGMDTLIPQLPDLALPPPPPAPPKCGAQQSGMRSAEDEDEALLQQHIMNIQMHILKQEEKMVEDEGFQYFVDVCRDDCLHVSARAEGCSALVFVFICCVHSLYVSM